MRRAGEQGPQPFRVPADIAAHMDGFNGESNARLAAARELALTALGYALAPLCYTPEDVAEPPGGEVLAKDAA